jgi:hypothetical protein
MRIDKQLDKFNREFELRDGLQGENDEIIESIAKSIDRCLITLFDLTESEKTYINYQKIIGDRPYRTQAIYETEFISIIDEQISKLSSDFWHFLEPYKVLLGIEEFTDKNKDIKNISLLKRLLKETNALCKLSDKTPTTEPQVYNAVKEYVFLLFPDAKKLSGQAFPTTAKVYKPDIFVPECKSAVEYKYIDTYEKINSTIAGISDDVKGYKKNKEYKYFFAVFYFKNHFITQERFKKIWEEKEFPSNWKPVFCIETK